MGAGTQHPGPWLEAALPSAFALVAILVIFQASACRAQAGVADTSGGRTPGLFFAASCWPGAYVSAGGRGSAVDIGAAVGYDVAPGVAPWMTFLTGHHHLPGVEGLAKGPMGYGGFALGLTVQFRPGARLHPVLSIAYVTGTLLDERGAGYNQEGFRIAQGGSFELSRYCNVAAQAMYGRDYRTRWIGEASDASTHAPKSVGSAGFLVTFLFYPNVFP